MAKLQIHTEIKTTGKDIKKTVLTLKSIERLFALNKAI